MDRARYSRIAHSFLPVSAPLDAADMHDVLGRLPLDAGRRALDIGCGRGALLVDLMDSRGVHGTGVDIDGEALRLARAAAESRNCAYRLTLIEARALEAALQAPFDLTLCVGSSHALGGPKTSLEHLARWTGTTVTCAGAATRWASRSTFWSERERAPCRLAGVWRRK
jgi:SAM-dependent methyltransferase